MSTDTPKETTLACLIGQHCLIRTYSAGVHIGVLAARDGQAVTLTGARRIWRWQGAFTLSEVATSGVARTSRLSVEVTRIDLIEAIEIIPTTETARSTFEACHEG